MGRDFVKHGVGIAMRGKPGFRGGAIVGEIKELGTFVGTDREREPFQASTARRL